MALKLEDRHSWEEIGLITLDKVKDGIKKSEHKKFLSWFNEREKLGYRFDPFLVLRAFKISQEIEKGLDHFAVLVGREGLGKSTLAVQLAAWVNPNFEVRNICTTAKDFIELLKETANRYEGSPEESNSIILDEGTELLSREAMGSTNKALMKTFFIQRALRYFVIICIPNFFMLDTVVRDHRVRTLVEILDRGKYKCIVGVGINKVSKDGRQNKSISGVRIPNGFFWHGYFSKEFPNTLNYEDYEMKKHKDIRSALDRIQSDSPGSDKKFVKAADVAREIGMKTDVMGSMCRKGTVKSKKIGERFYIPIEEYNRILANPDTSNRGTGEENSYI